MNISQNRATRSATRASRISAVPKVGVTNREAREIGGTQAHDV